MLKIQVKNSYYSQTYTTNLTVISNISQIEWIDFTSCIPTNSSQLFQVNFKSLGEPSCSYVTYQTSNNANYTIGFIGTSLSTCQSTFPTFSSTINSNYLGDYSALTSSNMISFSSSKIMKTGNLRLYIQVKNSQSLVFSTTNVTVVSVVGLCNIPTVDIVNKSSLFYQPAIYARSDLITLTTQTIINCSSNASNTIQWNIYKVDNKTGNQLGLVAIANNPTLNYADLVIQPSTLSYGLYKFVYMVTMNYNSIYTNQVETYIKVVPSGLLISSLVNAPSGGTYQITRGTSQAIQLNPGTYSKDVDVLISMKSLNYSFYCRVIDNSLTNDFVQISYGVYLDLLTMKKNYTSSSFIQSYVNANTSQSCFDSISNLEFFFCLNYLPYIFL